MTMRIAVDAMGGDFAPREIVKGAVDAAHALDGVERIFLVGDKAQIEAELARIGRSHPKIEIRHAAEVIGMDESPAMAFRKKKDSSIGRAVEMVKDGEADAVVSAGNTGAVVVAATLRLRTLAGVDRPTIAAVMPTQGPNPLVLVDAGANIEGTPRLLCQFAAMGSAYSTKILGRPKPIVGLVSIGGEDIKGNDVTLGAFGILSKSKLNFRGNVEGHDFFKGETDVAVCDGFVGNIILKTSESVAHAIGFWLKREFKRNPVRILGALLLKGALRSLKQSMDPELYGGAPLLGVNGVCIITHGASSSKAILHAVRVAAESVNHHLNDTIVENIAAMNAVEGMQ